MPYKSDNIRFLNLLFKGRFPEKNIFVVAVGRKMKNNIPHCVCLRHCDYYKNICWSILIQCYLAVISIRLSCQKQ